MSFIISKVYQSTSGFASALSMFAAARRQTPLTSNSSSYPISHIAEGLPSQQRMMGLHFYMPAFLIPLVEIVRATATDIALANEVGDWMWALGKRPVQVNRDIEGFLANRIQHALIREAVNMLELGIASPQDIDAAIRYSFGCRLAAADPAGIRVVVR